MPLSEIKQKAKNKANEILLKHISVSREFPFGVSRKTADIYREDREQAIATVKIIKGIGENLDFWKEVEGFIYSLKVVR
jgi:hypothetical protein